MIEKSEVEAAAKELNIKEQKMKKKQEEHLKNNRELLKKYSPQNRIRLLKKIKENRSKNN